MHLSGALPIGDGKIAKDSVCWQTTMMKRMKTKMLYMALYKYQLDLYQSSQIERHHISRIEDTYSIVRHCQTMVMK